MKKLYLEKEIDSINKVLSLLGYEEIKRHKTLFKGYLLVEYRSNDDNSIQQDRLYMIRSTIPFFFVVLSSVFAATLATIFLILNFAIGASFDRLTYFFILMVPAFIFILISTLLSLKRYFDSLHNLEAIASISLLEKEKINHEHSK